MGNGGSVGWSLVQYPQKSKFRRICRHSPIVAVGDFAEIEKNLHNLHNSLRLSGLELVTVSALRYFG